MSTIATETALPTGTWVADPVHSSVGFSVKHMAVHTFRGRFEDYAARLDVADDGSATLSGTVRAESIVVKDDALTAHLASPEFFDVERYPELRFESTAIRRRGDVVELDGRLTIKGSTLPVTATGTIAGPHVDADGAERLALDLETAVDRRQFGLDWNAPLPKGGYVLGNEVKLQTSLAFVRE